MVVEESHLEATLGPSTTGHQFEGKVAANLRKYQPPLSDIENRRYLPYPTYSGMRHQYDCIFKLDGIIYVIECKRQSQDASKNQIYYFNSLITDHILGIKADKLTNELRGIFVSTTDLDDNSMIYATTNGIRIVTPKMPPLEYMLGKVEGNRYLKKNIEHLLSVIMVKSPLFSDSIMRRDPLPATIHEEYMSILVEWRETIEAGSGAA
ncbi:MAG TPA: hypothetical protein VIH27_02590 [Nitrososphaerales archaeon]